MRSMASDVDHEAEVANQVAIAEEVGEDVRQFPGQSPAPPSEEPTVDEQSQEAPVEEEEPTVTVQRVGEPVHVRVAGYELDLREESSVEEVPAEIADLLEDSESVEVVA
jgi:hypothetical protein